MKKKRRTGSYASMYTKGSMVNMINELSEHAGKFRSRYSGQPDPDVDSTWEAFKHIVQKTVDRHIPSKMISCMKYNLTNNDPHTKIDPENKCCFPQTKAPQAIQRHHKLQKA